MREQALYLRMTAGLTACCGAVGLTEFHRYSCQHQSFCAACLGDIQTIIPMKPFVLPMEWPWVPSTSDCSRCGASGARPYGEEVLCEGHFRAEFAQRLAAIHPPPPDADPRDRQKPSVAGAIAMLLLRLLLGRRL